MMNVYEDLAKRTLLKAEMLIKAAEEESKFPNSPDGKAAVFMAHLAKTGIKPLAEAVQRAA
jgi:hypothetical protein